VEPALAWLKHEFSYTKGVRPALAFSWKNGYKILSKCLTKAFMLVVTFINFFLNYLFSSFLCQAQYKVLE
jgi:hypothetical protein